MGGGWAGRCWSVWVVLGVRECRLGRGGGLVWHLRERLRAPMKVRGPSFVTVLVRAPSQMVLEVELWVVLEADG